VAWPGHDVAILGLLAVYILVSYGLVQALQRQRRMTLRSAA
jgi:hypothetical protein